MAKILIIRLTSLGDVIFTLPLVNTLKSDNNEIGYMVSEKGLDVIRNNPAISKLHFVPLNEWKKRPFSIKTLKEFIEIIKEVRAQKYDIAIDCHQMFKNLFLFAFCGAKRRITFKDAREFSILGANELIPPKAKFRDFNYHIVERQLDYARYLGIEPKEINFPLPETSAEAKNKINDLTKKLDEKPILILSPATTWQNKHWAEENWAKVASEFHQKFNIIFTGTKFDEELINRIINKTNIDLKYTNLTGKTNIEELRELFSRAKIVIAPDSGSAHLAWASGIPSVITIFTCTPPKKFGPYSNPGKYFAISGNLPCQPCFKKNCKLKNNKNQCTYTPEPDKIIKIVNKLTF